MVLKFKSKETDYTVPGQSILDLIKNLIIGPLKFGIIGFSIFFTIIISIKIVLYLIDPESTSLAELHDVFISLIGFGAGFLVDFLIRLKKILNKFDV